MANITTFHKGAKVRRTGRTIGGMVNGGVYTVTRYLDGNIQVEEIGQFDWYRAEFFEPARPDAASVPMLVEGEGSVLMANISEEGEVLQVIMAMPGLINLERPDEMIGYCIYDSVGIYKLGFTDEHWARELFQVIDAATLSFKIPTK